MASWRQFSFHTLLWASMTGLKLGNTSFTLPLRNVSFDPVFYKFYKKLLFFYFQQGKQGFWFLIRDSQWKVLILWTTLKCRSWFPWNQSCVKWFIFGRASRNISDLQRKVAFCPPRWRRAPLLRCNMSDLKSVYWSRILCKITTRPTLGLLPAISNTLLLGVNQTSFFFYPTNVNWQLDLSVHICRIEKERSLIRWNGPDRNDFSICF